MYKTIGVLVLTLILTTAALAHSWYDSDCCGENDCEPVKVYVDEKGNYAVMKNGNKWYLDNPRSVRPSQDNSYHVCIYDNRVWCLYVPPGV